MALVETVEQEAIQARYIAKGDLDDMKNELEADHVAIEREETQISLQRTEILQLESQLQ